jgi:drug/metabolite transporter (DMT)-like permease
MNWLIIAISGYLLLAIESVISKYLLAGRIRSWQLYAFYIGLFSSFSLVFAPFGLAWYGTFPFMVSIFSGIIFYLSLIFLYQSLLKSSASRVYVLYGTVSTIATTLFSGLLLRDHFTLMEIYGIAFLIIGGIFISYKFYASRFFSNSHRTVAAGILVALSLVLLKYGYNEQKFVTGYIDSRLGILAGALLSLAVPSFRKSIKKSLRKRKNKENAQNLFGAIGAKTLAGIGTLLINFSISLGSVAIVNSLVSIQYILTFIFALGLSFYFKKIFIERFSVLNMLTKLAGILSVALGTMLVIFK